MNQMLAQISSLPALIEELFDDYDDAIRSTINTNVVTPIKQIYLTGCGDSYFAALGSQLAFHQFTGIPTHPMTSLHYARYEAGFMQQTDPDFNLVIGTSISGSVSRTIEALRMGNQFGALTLAITATSDSPITNEVKDVILTQTPDFPDPPGTNTPGIRTYFASQLALMLIAINFGELNKKLSKPDANKIRRDVRNLRYSFEQTISECYQKAKSLVEKWSDVQEFVFVGGGPNYGTALFSAAKILEASGDIAVGQETEEWCHLQYFARFEKTPTIFITAADRDLSRINEALFAAKTIGRQTALIIPLSFPKIESYVDDYLFTAETPEVFSPLLLAIPGELMAAYRADLIGENYFRGFGGGRNIEEGGGVSRIRTSDTWEKWK